MGINSNTHRLPITKSKSDNGNQSEKLLSNISSVIGSEVASGGSVSAQSTRRVANNVRGLNGDDNIARGKNRSNHSAERGIKSVTETANLNFASSNPSTRFGEHEWRFGKEQEGAKAIPVFSFQSIPATTNRVSQRREGESRVRFKEMARSNNTRSCIGPNGGNPSASKNPKRTLEVRDECCYSIGFRSKQP
ncbi:hypothetical protein C5167_049084 [Papaver somniferum]|uniref:Uncharacterized protein n=1 Tax=Papaver somniferum TaxID=3469 RepID=A0A4Y7KND6_PAPSO|nr:hypothetical protein C5167_049084 [Papaver somniferum]